MKTIKNFLLMGLGLIGIVSAVGGYVYGAWHLFVIAICAGLLFKAIYNPKNELK